MFRRGKEEEEKEKEESDYTWILVSDWCFEIKFPSLLIRFMTTDSKYKTSYVDFSRFRIIGGGVGVEPPAPSPIPHCLTEKQNSYID